MESDAWCPSTGGVSGHNSHSVWRDTLKVTDIYRAERPDTHIFHCCKNVEPRRVWYRTYRGIGPEGALPAVTTGSAGGAGVLAEVVVAGNGLSAEVAHEAATAARHPVAAL